MAHRTRVDILVMERLPFWVATRKESVIALENEVGFNARHDFRDCVEKERSGFILGATELSFGSSRCCLDAKGRRLHKLIEVA